MTDTIRRKFYKALYYYIRYLRYRRLEGWGDSTEISQHLSTMINKYCEVLWPTA
jgi:hypothetical protein